jgi:hypothetical protein
MFVQFQISFHVNIAIAVSYANFIIPKITSRYTLHTQHSAEVFMLEPQQLPVQLRVQLLVQLLVPPLARELGPEQPPARACRCRR